MTESLPDLLASIEHKPASYLRLARRIESLTAGSLQSARVSFLSSFTAEIIQPYLIVEGARHGLQLQAHFCPFNQVEIQAFDSSSELYASDPDVIVIALRLEESVPDLLWRFVAMSGDDIACELEKLRERLRNLVGQIRERSSATVLLFNFVQPAVRDAGLADLGLEVSQSDTIARVNAIVASVCREYPAAYVFDLAHLVAELGHANSYDAKLFWRARIPFSFAGQLGIARKLSRYVRASMRPSCKCLVVDLDNTLWGGVLGEDGLQGIALGEDYPGNLFKQFQRRLLSLRDQGILLAIASKNNETDVLEALQGHPDMVLQSTDFAAMQIHWTDKASSLRAISEQLNIGVDSLAFFDDSPVERAFVQRELPEVTVIEVPADPMEYEAALEQSGAFDRLLVSGDDRRRADMMRESNERDSSRQQAASVDDFLRELEMVATIGKSDSDTLPRIEQLLAKTNQFNLTTRRHTAATLQTLIEAQNAIILWMRLSDRFGDNGLTGVAIGIPEQDDRWRVDSLLLSCRVIGRQAERVLLGSLVHCVAQRGGQTLVGEYIPSGKNNQVAELFPSLGFQTTNEHNSLWTLDIRHESMKFPDFIRVEYDGELAGARVQL